MHFSVKRREEVIIENVYKTVLATFDNLIVHSFQYCSYSNKIYIKSQFIWKSVPQSRRLFRNCNINILINVQSL